MPGFFFIQGKQLKTTFKMWGKRERKKEMFYLTTHSTHFIYGYMASDIWLRTILIVRKETRCCHVGYSYRLTARVLLYAPSHRQDSTYHSLCYTSRGALAGVGKELCCTNVGLKIFIAGKLVIYSCKCLLQLIIYIHY